jgi:hypothetical protein
LATTQYGRFIGRVGALAVALGIGAAIAQSPGLAIADDSPSGATGSAGAAGSDGATGAAGAPGGRASTAAATKKTDDSAADKDTTESDSAAPTSTDNDDTPGNDTPANDTDADASEAANDLTSVADGPNNRHAHSTSIDADSDPETSHSTGNLATAPSPDLDASAARFVTTSAGEPDLNVDTATPHIVHATADASIATTFSSLSEPSAPTRVSTGLGGLVNTVLSVFRFGTHAANADPVTPPQAPMLWTMLGWARREIGNLVAPFTGGATTPVATLAVDDAPTTTQSPLATDEQLAAERIAAQTVKTLPVTLMKIVLRQQFLSAAQKQYPNGLDAGSLAALDKAVDEYAMAAALQQQLLDSMNPTVVTQVAPPHVWFGQNVPGGRILYDNPDTIYRFMGVNGASQYEIHGQFLDYGDPNARPADTTFSVLEGLAGTTSSILTAKDLVVDEDGRFVITVSTEPADGRPNHLQMTSGSTIIAARNTLGDWSSENPMTLSIERVGGPPDSLFAQIGGFAFLGKQVAANPLLTSLVSLVPPLPYMPPALRGIFTAAILVVRGASQESKYMALASTDPDTGQPRPANTVSQPSSNAEFLANQLQSNGHFELADGQALVLTIDPGRAGYFIVPTYDVWTITDDYWNKQTSLNNEQAVANADGTYTVVISPTDPGVTNWIDTGGLHQGTISIRFQDLGPDPDDTNAPRIVDQQVIDVADASQFFADDPKYVVTAQQREDQLAARKAGFDRRWSPFPQP